MRNSGINGKGELRGQLANPGSLRKMAVKTECVCVCAIAWLTPKTASSHTHVTIMTLVILGQTERALLGIPLIWVCCGPSALGLTACLTPYKQARPLRQLLC